MASTRSTELTGEECRSLGQSLAGSLAEFLSETRDSVRGAGGGPVVVHVDDTQMSVCQRVIVREVLSFLNGAGSREIAVRIGADRAQAELELELRVELDRHESEFGRTIHSDYVVLLTLRDAVTGAIEFERSAGLSKQLTQGLFGRERRSGLGL